MNHYDDDDLARFAFHRHRVPDPQSLEDHVNGCPDCADRLGFIRAIDAGLADEATWTTTDELDGQSPSFETLRRFAAINAREDAEAGRLLGPLLTRPGALEWAEVTTRRRFRTGGVVRALGAAANRSCEREPKDALKFADAAIAIADQIPDNAYPGGSVFAWRGLAYKERANALRFLGRYDEALQALDTAERCYRRLPMAPFELAIVAYVRATVLWKMEKPEPAIVLAREAAEAFALFGQAERYIHARLLEAVILFQRRDLVAARDRFRELLAIARERQMELVTARLANDLASCLAELGETAEAGALVAEAMRTYEKKGLATELVRTKVVLAKIAMGNGRADEAVTRFTAAMHAFEEHGMMSDAALAMLHLADALIASGRASEVSMLCADLSRRFREAGMMTSALTALAYVDEQSARGQLTPKVTEHVRTFFTRLERKPELLFAPPPPA